MAYNDLIATAKNYFPDFQVKYKNQDTLMKILGALMFFNPNFMKLYTTTIGHTVYVPSEEFAQKPEFTSILIHECTHMYDNKRLGLLFDLGYLFPQILFLPVLLLFFVLSWKIVLPLALLTLVPLPAPWRANLERRAYFVSMLADYLSYNIDPSITASHFANYMRGSSYYFMWPFEKDATFLEEATRIKAGKPSCASEPELFKQVNDLIAAAKK